MDPSVIGGAMGIAREIAQYFFGSPEWGFATADLLAATGNDISLNLRRGQHKIHDCDAPQH